MRITSLPGPLVGSRLWRMHNGTPIPEPVRQLYDLTAFYARLGH